MIPQFDSKQLTTAQSTPSHRRTKSLGYHGLNCHLLGSGALGLSALLAVACSPPDDNDQVDANLQEASEESALEMPVSEPISIDTSPQQPVPSVDNLAKIPEAMAASDEEPTVVATNPAPNRCSAPSDVSAAPATIDELVELINSLPKPVTIPCLLESLERPLSVFLTRSAQSAQPAVGAGNPRVFVFLGALSFTIVPGGGGESSHNLEFAFRTSDIEADRELLAFPNPDVQAVRGEIGFPVYQDLTDAVLEERIAGGLGSLCGGCHTGERPAGAGYFEGAFVSDVMPPFPPYDVPLANLREAFEQCDWDLEEDRCEVLSALFDYGEVLSVDFL